MKCHILISGRNKKKYISTWCLLKILPRVLSFKYYHINYHLINKGLIFHENALFSRKIIIKGLKEEFFLAKECAQYWLTA